MAKKKLPWLGMESLSQLIYKTVRITTNDGLVTEGKAISYTHEFESGTGHELVGLKMNGYIDCFDETMIKDIEILEESDNNAAGL
jgi:hypothetical protein